MKNLNLQIQNKFQILKNHTQEIILFFNRSGMIIDCNQTAKEKLGYGNDILHRPISDVFQKAAKVSDGRLLINKKYRNKASETVAYRKNQTCFTVELMIATSSRIPEFVGVCTAVDISEKKHVIRELEQVKGDLKSSREVKNEFVANITHELKTPVNGIMGLTENLLDTELTPKQLETLNIIQRCCNNMNTLINNLLDFTKIDNNKMVLEKREFVFRKLIDDVIAFNINKINEKGLKLIVNVSNDIPERVIGDECRLTQIINNLFSNAIKFTSVGQIVLEVVKTAETKNEVELFFMLMDTGIGISTEERDKLFLSFSQVDGSITRRFGGTGLGLSICRKLVEAMKGSITVNSEKGKGSTFSFTVRLGASQSTQEEDKPKEDYKWHGFEQKKQKELENWPPVTDYIGKLLSDANLSPQAVMGPDLSLYYDFQEKANKTNQNISAIIEKLRICIEMENWGKAEQIAAMIKNLMPKDDHQLKNKALHLLLSVRKEDHDACLAELIEFEKLLNEKR